MLRVTVELVPHGIESRRRVIASGEIANDRTGNPEVGNYDVTLRYQVDGGFRSRTGRVKGHDRSDPVWDLIRLAIDAADRGDD